tara:strand:- start:52 stop:723 length:672 start_codon:yes stop_codon:yes gene_type:complete
MTIIWPTKNDIHVDDESGTSSLYRAKNMGDESSWAERWNGMIPTSKGSWIPISFGLDTTISLPTTDLTLKTVRGTAVIKGFGIDFIAETDPPTVLFEHSHGHIYFSLQLVFVGGFVAGYKWNQDLDDPVVRDFQIGIGQAIVQNGSWEKWFPVSYPEGWRVATGSFDSGQGPKSRKINLGFRPIAAKATGSPDPVLKDYGFNVESDDLSGTYEATLFDKTATT